MSGIFSTFNTANKGMIASQTAIQTISHNVSNAKSEGFSRQRVEFKADLAYRFAGVGQIGTGVRMVAVSRVVNDYVDKQIRKENSTLYRFGAKAEVLDHLQIIFNEPSDTGLNFNLGEMFLSWHELSKNPEIPNFKTIVVEKSITLADNINKMMSQLNSLKEETVDLISKNVDEFNSIITQLDNLNKQIYNTSVKGQIPNDLMDERDLLLKKLSSLSDFKADFDMYNRVIIKIEGNEILGPDAKYTLQMDEEKGEPYLLGEEGDIIPQEQFLKAGSLKGYIDALVDLEARKEDLMKFTNTLADTINGEEPIEGDKFFIVDEKGNIKVNQRVIDDNNLIRAGYDDAEGDGSRALKIAGWRNEKVPGVGKNFGDMYRDIVIKVGISIEHAENMVMNQEVLTNQLEFRREQVSGVSINEEVTNLIQFQKAFDANAKVISVLTEMLDTLINKMGV